MKRTSLGSLIAAAAVGALMTATAPAVHAEPKLSERTIKEHCEDAGGDHETEVTESGTRWSTCSYQTAGGGVWVDYFKNGRFDGELGPL